MGYHSSDAANASGANATADAAVNICYDDATMQSLLSELSSIIKIKHSGADFSRAFKTVGSARDGHSDNDVASYIFNKNIETYSIALASINLIFNNRLIGFKIFSKYRNFDAAIDLIDSHIKEPSKFKLYKKLECWMEDEEFQMVSSLATEIKDKIVVRNWADIFNIAEVEYNGAIASNDVLFHCKNREAQREVIKRFNENLLNAAAIVRLKRLHDSLVVLSPIEIARQERSRRLDEEYEELKRREEDKERRRAERTAKANSKKAAEPQPEPPPPSSARDIPEGASQPVHLEPATDEAEQVPTGDVSSAADETEEAPNTHVHDAPEHVPEETGEATSGDDTSAADMPEEAPNTDDPEHVPEETGQAPSGDDISAADMPLEEPHAADTDPEQNATYEANLASNGDGSSAADMSVEAPHPANPEHATKEPDSTYDHEAEFNRRQASAAKFLSDQDLIRKSKKDVMQRDKDRLADELSSHYYYIMDTRNNLEELTKLAEVARASGEKINLSNFNGDIATGNRELLRWIFPKVTSKKQSLNARINEWGAVLAHAEESGWDNKYLCNELKRYGLKKLLKKHPDGKPSLTYNKEIGYWEIKNLPSDASLMINGTIVDTINDVAIDEFLYY